jgi:hypothetical protein
LVCFVWCAENEELRGGKGEKRRKKVKKKTQEESEENKVL